MNSSRRLLQQEQLDDLSLSGQRLTETLSSLKLINRWFGNHRYLAKTLIRYCKKNSQATNWHIVDLGCGGGDCIQHLSKSLERHNIKATFTGIDGNKESISFAQSNTSVNTPVNFMVANILAKDFLLPECDILTSSHFIYHFDDQQLINFLKKTSSTKIKHIIFSELYRSKTSYFLFKTIRFLLPISQMAKSDGLIAIKRAFSIKELKSIIENSKATRFKIEKKPFFRMLVTIDFYK